MKTVVISGTVAKRTGNQKGNYADIEKVYNVDDSVTVDDVYYYLEKRNARAIPIKIDGSEVKKLSFVISMDSNRANDADIKKPLNRVMFARKLEADLKTLDWQIPKEKRELVDPSNRKHIGRKK